MTAEEDTLELKQLTRGIIYKHVQFNEKADFWGEKGKEKGKHSRSFEYLIWYLISA